MLIDSANMEDVKKRIRNAKEKPVIIKARDDEFNRLVLEYGKFDVLLCVESGRRKDKLKQLDSGLNEVLASIAAKNNVAIGFDLVELAGLEKMEKAVRLARIKQNITLCRKAGARLALVNCADKIEGFSLLISLAASTKQAKEAIYF